MQTSADQEKTVTQPEKKEEDKKNKYQPGHLGLRGEATYLGRS
jgi:hypothetical protein